MGVKGAEWSDARIADLACLVAEGLTSGEIARKMGITRGAVMGKIRRQGIRLATEPTRGVRAAPPKPIAKPDVKKKITGDNFFPPGPPPLSMRLGAGPAILALRINDCRWPSGDPSGEDFHFCCKPSRLNEPYCLEHATLAANKGSGMRQVWQAWPIRRGP